MMRFWKSKGVDGFRMDVITSISKDLEFPDNAIPYKTSNQHNVPRMHEFIHEMNQEVLTPLDMMSVGEAPAAKSTDAYLLVDPKREELDMVFTFEHMHIDREKGNINGRWALTEPDIISLKKIMSEWQLNLRNKGWNALYFENHHRGRVISRWGNDDNYRYESATAFATILHGMQGTPFIYQGEEIGMTNAKFELDEYIDVELRGNYEYFVEQQKTISKEDFLKAVHKVSRDNDRTPMHWDNSENGGFSEATPWFKVNPNYKDINVASDINSDKSVFRFYQKLIQLRHEENIILEGSYELLLPEHPHLFVYKRVLGNKTWLVGANLSEADQTITGIMLDNRVVKVSNYKKEKIESVLKPYESFIIETN